MSGELTINTSTGTSSVTIPSIQWITNGTVYANPEFFSTVCMPRTEEKPMAQFVAEKELDNGRKERVVLTVSVTVGGIAPSLTNAESEKLAKLACEFLGLKYIGAA
jgi:hypothetical protein